MGHTTDLLTGLAQLLAANGIGTWRANGAYPAAETGIILDNVPQSPAAVIVLSAYSVDDNPTLADSVDGVQIRTRTASADPRPTNDLADRVFDLLHGAHDLVVGGVEVQFVRRVSWTPLPPDQQQRHERSDNYYFTTHRPSTNRQ